MPWWETLKDSGMKDFRQPLNPWYLSMSFTRIENWTRMKDGHFPNSFHSNGKTASTFYDLLSCNSHVYSDFHENAWNVCLALENEKTRMEKKRRTRRKTDGSCETLIGAGFPRYQEIVKRFMKAFMKGFTRHGPNWGPGFSLLLHTCCHDDEEAPPFSPWSPAGPLHALTSFLLFVFPSLREQATVSSIDPRKCLVFHRKRHIRRWYFARPCFFPLLFFPRALILLGRTSRTVFFSIETFSR